jgi:uncharacterized protein with PQ loop repeat
MDLPSIALVVAFLTTFVGILVKIIGFPDQARKNYKRKSTEGLSTAFFLMTVISYVLWTLHGIFEDDWVLIIGQGLGIITAGFILMQIIYYQNYNKKVSKRNKMRT